MFDEKSPEVMEDKQSSAPYLIPGAIIVAGVLIAGAIFYSSSSRPPQGAVLSGGGNGGVNGAGTSAALAGDLADDDPFLGSPEAPVTIVEFSDFQCPFCRKLWRETLPQIKEKYVKKGLIKFVYRDFPLTSIHPGAEPAALAGECADEQNKFWVMHDKIFEEQDKGGQGTVEFDAADLKKWAREIGLNGAQFDSCLDSRKYAAEVEKDLQDGQGAGVTGTPGTFVNGRIVQGAVPYAQFETIIEEELKKVK